MVLSLDFVNSGFLLYTYNKEHIKIIVGSKNPNKEKRKKDLVAIIQDFDCRENNITPSQDYNAQKETIENLQDSEIKIGRYRIRIFRDGLSEIKEEISFLEIYSGSQQKHWNHLRNTFSYVITKLLRYKIIN